MLLFLAVLGKLLLFDLLWCAESGNFSVFHHPAAYFSAIFVALFFTLPAAFGTRREIGLVLCAALDLLLTANLLYSRTYFTAIPSESYRLAGNLRDFLPAVADSLRVPDLLLPVFTLLTAAWVCSRPRERTPRRTRRRWIVALLIAGGLCYTATLPHGGFRGRYRHLLAGHRSHVCAVPEFTIFGTLLYDALHERIRFTPTLQQEVETFLASRSSAPAPIAETRGSLVVILLESFESWLLEREAAGIEITPRLNRFLREPGVIYAPHMLTQVKGGRSIDAQLLLNTGLLPLENGCYAATAPRALYPSLAAALREKYSDLRTCAFTPDNPSVWNQQAVARSFGFERLVARSDLRKHDAAKSGRIDDGELFERCLESLDSLIGGAAPSAQETRPLQRGRMPAPVPHLYIQCITYSGHVPFILPERLRTTEFPRSFPDKLRNYLTAAHYTDAAVGTFIDGLRRRPAFADALIVLTGDHEGLAADRETLAASEAGRKLVSRQRFTPLLILNAPVTLRREQVMGQIDIYPTLCDLLGLGDYFWQGLGHSILRDGTPPAAADPHLRITGDTSRLTATQAERLRQAWELSDRIIRSDYFARTGRNRSVEASVTSSAPR